MKTRFASLAMLATSVAALTAFSAAADQSVRPILDKFPGRQPYHAVTEKMVKARKPAATLTTWKGGFTDHHNTKRTFIMVGTDPSTNNGTTTIPFYVVPVQFKYVAFDNKTFNPKKDQYPNGDKVLDNFLNSPVVQSNVKFKSGGQALGKTQYLDAYQRGNFWQANVQKNTNYHVVLGSPTVLKPLKITVQAGQGSVITNPFGTIPVGTYGFGAMDTQINNYIQSHSQITADSFPFFVSDNIYLTSGGCCIGGYHYATSTSPSSQSYGYTTLVTEEGSFSEDVSAATHEVGEWMDDPFPGNNVVGCQDNSWLENGDPLVNGLPNFGNFVYTVNGFDYHLQDLVYLAYFGAPDVSVGNLRDFQGAKPKTYVCPGQ